MFTVRPYREEDAATCGDCFYKGFFTCSTDQNDKILLHDYAQVLIEKCNFTSVRARKTELAHFVRLDVFSVSSNLSLSHSQSNQYHT